MSTQTATSTQPAMSTRTDVPTEPARAQWAEVGQLVPGVELVLRGRLDVGSAGPVRESLHLAVDQGHGDLVVHLDDVEVHDAAGLGVLVGVHRRARLADRRLVLVGVPARLEWLIRHTRLNRVLVRAREHEPIG